MICQASLNSFKIINSFRKKIKGEIERMYTYQVDEKEINEKHNNC